MDRLEVVTLLIDELEALRLADLNGLYHEDAGRCMNVSRATFSRILSSAHRKVAEALTQAKALCIEGGEVIIQDRCSFECPQCHHHWDEPFGPGCPAKCPVCGGGSRQPKRIL